MLSLKAARDKGFEVTVPKEVPNEQEKPEPFFLSEQADRLARAKRWIQQARGKTANLQTEPKE
jgi:hypothetical protein